ncbi:MAG: hypothetical protein NC300_10295 [Bacteroidales bacterium]|nr:hypothetical protein [Clostridium sp.]MCM1204520.1 hypothetical protein [Bacteroidales bacterium]
MQIGEAREKQSVVSAGKLVTASAGITPEKSGAAQKKDEKENGVTVDISRQALDMLERQMQASRESAEAMGKAAADQGKIMEIARRISRGDKVPPKDEKKLMEFDFKLYQMAKMSAVMNEGKKHKKHKSLFEDEEENDKREKLRALAGDSSVEGAEAEPAVAEVEGGEAEE